MKNRTIITIFIIGILAACTDDDPNTPDGPAAGCLLTKVTETYNDGANISTEITTTTYDSEGNLVKIEDAEEGDDPEGIELTYTNGRVVKAQYYEGNEPEDEPLLLAYEGNKLSKISASYEEDGGTYTYEYRFIYNGDAVSKVEEWTNEYCHYDESVDDWVCNTGDPYMDGVTEFTYSNGNLVKMVDKYFSEDGSLENQETTEITYDDKTNPFKGNIAWLIWEWELDIFFSANNPKTVSREYISYDGEGNVESTDTDSRGLNYNYDENGLPTGITEDDGDQYALTYECD